MNPAALHAYPPSCPDRDRCMTAGCLWDCLQLEPPACDVCGRPSTLAVCSGCRAAPSR